MSEDLYLVPALKKGQIHRTELIIKKSRFITSVGHCASVDEAKYFIISIANEFSDARHNCYAFNATAPGSTAYCGMSDDGEPHGTAGHPMLNVVLHSGIGEICCVVTRYFGGILLGTGGLVKAYQDSVKQAIDTLECTQRLIPVRLNIGLDHRYITKFMHIMADYQIEIEGQNFIDRAYYTLLMPKKSKEPFVKVMMELTKGQMTIEDLE